MKIFNKDHRIKLSQDVLPKLFEDELQWHREENKHPYTLYGKEIINIYSTTNIQVVLTKVCNYKCPFCIENDGSVEDMRTNKVPELLETVLKAYNEHGLTCAISITGGEPTLYKNKLKEVIDVSNNFSCVSRININTNGSKLENIPLNYTGIINLSRHHYTDEKNNQIFKRQINDITIPKNTFFQCVLLKDCINDIEKMKTYMDYYIDKGAKGFSFRGLTNLDEEKNYSSEVTWCKNNYVNSHSIFNTVAEDPEFEFILQNIGDHFIYEIYKYKEFPIRLTYSDFNWLRKVEEQERSKNQWFSRVTVVHSSNTIYAGWTYDINKIFSLT